MKKELSSFFGTGKINMGADWAFARSCEYMVGLSVLEMVWDLMWWYSVHN